ncbi:metallohydrolase/oxidoreductase [Chloropicon primus]|uniref:ribonuclease Z n=2 Tax=Chloropicon primus TaxID=1764295 RepID=A0A5B8MWJ8_9CHLO|nr:metallohydrolase/oxidoreductase [Chloropicon primus]UPR04138.1 metallohydrolase/oxidoreductase [Chloropicon primus]|eukprot:QDZ24929.1 metallohydrolase/oxidoreductase [Chloropicon primus]
MGKKDKGGGGGGGNQRNQSCYLQVLGLGCDTLDTLPSVLLFFDNERYLFNIGEGFQKFSLENRIKAARIDGIFLTRTTTEAAGGLPGTLLTLADKIHGDHDKRSGADAGPGSNKKPAAGGTADGRSFLSVFGPKGMKDFTNCLRTYINIRDIRLGVKEIGEGDAPVAASGASLREKESAAGAGARYHTLVKNEAVEISSVVLEVEDSDLQPGKRPRLEEEACLSRRNNSVDKQVAVSVYMIDLCDIPGKFLPHKAMELGVPKGPAFGKLCRGESVMNTFGKYVAPGEVMEPSIPGPTAIILDLPTVDHLRCLESKGVVEKYAKEQRDKEGKRLVMVHLSPLEVLRSEEFTSFLGRWPAGTGHVMVHHNGSEKQSIFSSAVRLQTELHELFPEFFPRHQNAGRDSASAGADLGGLGEQAIDGTNLLKYHLRPMSRYGPDESETMEGKQQGLEKEKDDAVTTTADGAEEKKQNLVANVIRRHEVEKPSCVSEASAGDLEVTFCGSGAAVPSKYRNLSGIYCQLSESGGILLDSGEGVCGQLTRRYGKARFDEVLANLKVVWVSHIHADHHSGLPSLLRMRSKVAKDPLVIVGPRQLRRVLSTYSKIEYIPIEFIDCSQTTEGKALPALLSDRLEQLGIASLRSVEVNHSCYNAFGVVLEGKSGWKLSFSGDTRPHEAFIKAAAGSTIFIHEATFENGLLEEALAKKHSLTKEAIESGAKAGAYRTILTHFSQRYPKVPVVDESFSTTTCVAFDLMTFNLKTIEHLPKVVPEVAARYEIEPMNP